MAPACEGWLQSLQCKPISFAYGLLLLPPLRRNAARSCWRRGSWVPLHAVPLHTVSARLEQAALGNERPDLSESNAVPPQGRPQEQ